MQVAVSVDLADNFHVARKEKDSSKEVTDREWVGEGGTPRESDAKEVGRGEGGKKKEMRKK